VGGETGRYLVTQCGGCWAFVWSGWVRFFFAGSDFLDRGRAGCAADSRMKGARRASPLHEGHRRALEIAVRHIYLELRVGLP